MSLIPSDALDWEKYEQRRREELRKRVIDEHTYVGFSTFPPSHFWLRIEHHQHDVTLLSSSPPLRKSSVTSHERFLRLMREHYKLWDGRDLV